jgi:hypothetical protein
VTGTPLRRGLRSAPDDVGGHEGERLGHEHTACDYPVPWLAPVTVVVVTVVGVVMVVVVVDLDSINRGCCHSSH